MSRAQPTEEGGRTIRFAWDLDLDINDTSTRLRLPAATSLVGDWSLHVGIPSAQFIKLQFYVTGAALASLGTRNRVTHAFSWIDGEGTSHAVEGGEKISSRPMPKTVNGTLMSYTIPSGMLEGARLADPKFQPSHRRFSFFISFTDLSRPAPPAPKPSILPEELARAVARWSPPSLLTALELTITSTASTFTKRPNNVRLFFPGIGTELWASSSMLSTVSPYWKTLLESDFQENVRRGRKRQRIEGAGAVEATPPVEGVAKEDTEEAAAEREGADDSDEETDDWVKRTSPHVEADSDDDDSLSYRQVTITETAYSTYRAVLLYLTTSHIAFSPLTSSLLPHSPSGIRTRSDHRDMILASEPLLPPPVSPKSVYALAHLLEVPSLVACALTEFKSQLTVDNAATELFSTASLAYDDIRGAAMDFTVKHWKEVKVSAGMKEVERKIKAGLLPHAGSIFVELMPKI